MLKRVIAFLIVLGCLVWAWPHIFPPPPAQPSPSPSATVMSDQDMDYYSQIFDYVMTTVKPGDSYNWQSYTASGIFTVTEPFTSKSGVACRKFGESITIGVRQGQSSGIACKRQGRDGWCRLKEGNALTCAMEVSPDWFNIATPGINGNMPSVNLSGPNVGVHGNLNPNINGNVNVNGPKKGYGADPADTVTGAAGSVAGPATKAIKNWFGDAFSKE